MEIIKCFCLRAYEDVALIDYRTKILFVNIVRYMQLHNAFKMLVII